MRLSEEAGVRNLFSSEQNDRERQIKALEGHDGKKQVASVAAIAISKIAKKAIAKNQIAPSEVRVLARLAIEADDSVVEAFVGNVMRRGVQVEQIYLQLLAPAVELLGAMWDSDELNFLRMTAACCRLQKVIASIGDMSDNRAVFVFPEEQKVGRIFLSAVPGSQHTLGVRMLGDIFGKNGWRVDVSGALNQADILKEIKAVKYDVIGFSIGSAVLLPRLASLVSALRASMSHGATGATPLMVGGPLFSKGVGQSCDQDVIEVKDVDYSSSDAMAALVWANAELLKANKYAVTIS
jgi:MerR family transcriptional regulator, light-induced transcriptional regulator